MKKTLLSIVALSLLTAQADAQKVYFRAGLGYALPHAGQSIAGNEWPYSGSTNNSTFTYSLEGASFSAGLQGYLALGYNINKNISLQLDAQLGLSSRQFDFQIQNISIGSVPSNVTISEHAKLPINLVPSMVVRTGGDPWDVYCRMGVALPLLSTIEKQNVITNLAGTGAASKRVETWELRSSFSAGFAAAAGFEYKMNPSTSLWAEVSVLSMSLYIQDAELTEYSYNGQNINLSQLGGTKYIRYSKNIQVDTMDFARQPAYTQPFSNVGINVGVRRTFGGERKREREQMEERRRRNR